MRSYYIFQNGRLRRKGNTLYLESESASSAPEVDEIDRPIGLSDNAERLELDEPDQQMMTPPVTEGQDEENETELSPSQAGVHTQDGAPVPRSSTPPRRRAIPIEDVEEILLFGEITMNTKLLNFLAQKSVPVHVFNYFGFYSGTYYPRETNVSGHLLLKQVEHYTDTAKRLILAKEIVRGAYHNLHRNLLYYRNRGKAVQAAVDALERESVQIERADSISALMGTEGRMRETYYRAFNDILNLESPFLKRVKRPPDNLINTLISFGNSLLYTAVLSQIYRTPLNPTISFLHEPGTRRFSLSLDLAEIFKPIIVDKMIFKLINKQIVTERDLLKEPGVAYLKKAARKVIVQEFDGRLRATIKHRRMRRNVSYRGFIRLECYKLVRHLLGDEPYRALRAWW